MEKYLVDIEFRHSGGISKTITIGVFDDFDQACISGNALLEDLESKFKLHVFPNGQKAKKERFSKNGGCFGSKNTLVTNLAYLKTPFSFYAHITTLKHHSIDDAIEDVLASIKNYRKQQEEDDGN